MEKDSKIEYERMGKNRVKITYNYSDGHRTEVVARVIKRGTYKACEAKTNNQKECVAQ